jgi:uncharacterized membrane protein
MAVAEAALTRIREKRVYLIAAILFPLLVLIGFGPTYYFKPFITAPPLASYLVQLHGAIMTAWVTLFVAQVFLIRTKNIRIHQRLGIFSIVLASLAVISGFFTAIAAAKNGAASTPPGFPRLQFLAVPLFDVLTFVVLFAAAIYYRKRAANHKRLMLVLAISLLPPAIARIPIASLQALGPLYFFGVPTLLCLVALFYDRLQNGKFNRVMVYAVLFLIASYPLRIMILGTETWLAIANWLITLSPV